MPRTVSISEDQRRDIVRMCMDDLGTDRDARGEFDKRRKLHTNAYRNRVRKKSDPWVGCSNTSIPLTTRAVDRMAIHIQATLFPRGSVFPIEAVPVGGKDPLGELKERAHRTAQHLRYQYRNVMRLYFPMNRGSRSFLLHGNLFLKEWWNFRERNVQVVERFPDRVIELEDENDPTSFFEREVGLSESVEQFFENMDVTTSEQMGESSWRYEVYEAEDRRHVTYRVRAEHDEETRDNVLVIKSLRLVKNQPQVDFVPMDDIYFSYDAPFIEDVRRTHLRNFLSLSDIKHGVRRGRWNMLRNEDMDAYERSVERAPGDKEDLEQQAGGMVPQTVRELTDVTEGIATDYQKPFEVYEHFYSYDIDGDGELEELTFWVDHDNSKLLRVAYISEDYHSDRRPILHAGLVPVENRLLHIGLAEVLMPIQVEMNTSVNNRNDAAALALMPPTYFRPASGVPPTRSRTRPGTMIPLDSPSTDVNQLPYQGNPFGTISVEQFLMAFVEDLSIGAASTGRQPARDQTARATLAFLQQDRIKQDYPIQQLLPAIDDMSHLTVMLNRLHGPESLMFRTVGSNDFQNISKRDLLDRVNFYFDVDSVSANREIRRLHAAQAFQGALEIAMMPPEAIPQGARILVRNFLESLDVAEVDSIIPDPLDFTRMPLPQEIENQMLRQGVPVSPAAADEHGQHIAIMEAAQQTPWFAMQPPEWVRTVWLPHKATHVRFLRLQQQQQAAVTGGSGISPISPLGRGDALAGLGDTTELASEAIGSRLTAGLATEG